MDGKGMLISLLSSFLCLYLLFALIKFLHTVWWTPIRLQHALGKQGIKGPAYKFLDGNSKEILSMRKESMSKPMNISSHYLFPRVQPHLYSWMEKYGTNVLHWIGPQPHLFVSDTEMIREILNNKEGVYPKPDTQVFEKKLLGDGISTSKGDKWARSRKLANHAFHGERLKSMFPDMIESSEMMLERWKTHVGKEIEVNEEFRLLTSEVISKTAFGSSYVQGEKIFEMLNKLVEIFARNEYTVRFLSKFIKSEDDIEADKLEKGVEESVIEMMKNREEKVMSGKAESFGNDFLGLLIKANHESDKRNRLSVQDVVDECKTFYLAGQENINAMLSWTVFLLAIHTDWQEEARKEVLKVFGQGVPNSDGISKLRIITMIIHETLRLYPPATCVMRKVEREARIGKIVLPANMNLYISALSVQHDPQIWGEDVDLFNPKRFSEGVANSVRNNMAAFLPFGLGPRSCVGSNFATTEAKIVLSMILQRYSFTLSPSHVHSPLQVLTILPQHGVQVILHAL